MRKMRFRIDSYQLSNRCGKGSGEKVTNERASVNCVPGRGWHAVKLLESACAPQPTDDYGVTPYQ